jgi:hypothetical protein
MNSLARLGFVYHLELVDPRGRVINRETIHNLIPEEGLTHMQAVTFKQAAQVPLWYLYLYEGDYTPDGTETAANLPGRATEFTAHALATRLLFNTGAAAAGSVDNSANRAEFEFTANKTVRGGAIVSASAKGSVVGVCTSVVKFASPKIGETGAVLRVIAANSLISI